MQLRMCFAMTGLLSLGGCATDRALSSQTVPDAEALAPAPAVTAAEPSGIQLVRYSGGSEASARSSVTSHGGRVLRHLPEVQVLYVAGMDQAGASSLAGTAGIAAVVADQVAPLRPAPSRLLSGGAATQGPVSLGTNHSRAQFFPFQWNMRVAQASAAWLPSAGGAGELVCVLDTGIDPGHLDIQGRLAPGRTTTVILNPRFPSDATPLDYDFHGTFVSSLIAGNGIGMASTAPDAQLCSIKVLGQDGRGTYGDLVAGLVQAANWNAHVINMSIGGVLDVSEVAFAKLAAFIQQGVNYARARGSLVVASSGNLGVNFDEVPKRFVHVPSMLSGVLSVGATAPINQRNFDLLASYSNYGGVRTLDLVAPGGDLVTGGVTTDLVLAACSQYATGVGFACGRTSYLFAAGTSFASPLVAGAAAVVESTKGPMSVSALEACLASSSDRVGSRWTYGAGRLNVLKALSCP